MARIGVFVCHCGTNIGGVVDVHRVVEAAGQMPQVVCAHDNTYTCSEPGQASIRGNIIENNLDRVVVASCSPSMHERTFRRTVSSAGLNPYLLEMANLREQCSWVHGHDKEAATHKAIELVRMAVAKVSWHEPLYPAKVGLTKRALVIGGGITGIQASLDIADSGYEVYLVEGSPTIGGHMAQLDKTFPTLDCSSCILTPKMTDVAQHPNITLLAYSEVEKVEGFIGNFDVQIRRKARYVDETKCTGCGTCITKCPWMTENEFDIGLSKRKAIYVPFPQAVPNTATIDKQTCVYFKTGKCRACEKFCDAGAINFDMQDEFVDVQVGAVIAATGYKNFDHTAYGEFGGGKYSDVISSLQLERLMSASGPTGGEILRPSDGSPPKNVVFISCVGSRDENKGRGYCSKVCCMYMAKHAIILKEHDPEVQCYTFYIDNRAGGKNFEEFLQRAQEEYGAIYLRGRVSKLYQDGRKIMVRGEDSLIGKPVEIPADLVVLATGIEAEDGVENLASKLNLNRDSNNFFTEAHPKLRPVETQNDGIFLAGACVGPKDIPDSVAQGSAAAAKVAALFSQDVLTTEPLVATMDPMRCTGCLLCFQICPFNAVNQQVTKDGRTVAVVNESICKGCGLCVSACRSVAASLRGFSPQQLFSEVMALWR